MSLLEYEQQIFLDAFHEDGLLVTARGLGLERIITSFLKVYCDAANLVLVLSTLSLDEEYYIEELEKDNVSPLPKVITNEYNASDRQKLYLQGGVLFITSRILVVDLLTDRVPIENVTGIIVCRAHRIVESCQEAFILRLYRQKNKTGFIKAFSHNATAFTAGFSHVERTMKNLFVRKLFLWPRFQANVQETLEKHKVDVVEIQVQLTNTMVACQAALLDLLNACIKELKRCNTAIDSEEITVENAISKSFDQMIRLQLDPVWHQLGPKTKQLVSDIKTLRLILGHLTQYDCVTFYNMVNSVRTSEKTFGQNTGWLFLESADNLFIHAKSRVYGDEESRKKLKKESKQKDVPLLEPCPKWEALAEVMEEISEHNKKADEKLGHGRVLIAAEDDRTCSQIKEFLCDGSQSLLARLFNKSIATKGEYLEEVKKRPIGKRKKQKISKDPDNVTLTQMVGKTAENGDVKEGEELPFTSGDAYYGVLPDPVTIIHPLHGCSDPFSLVRTLNEVQPRYIVLYDPDMEFVRQIEVYRATTPGSPLRVYFLMYTGSVEEQRYLTTLRKEKEAFEYLIREKATMVIPEEREGKMENDPNLTRDATPAGAKANTRKGGQPGQNQSQNKVIVDMREFRSELPSLIHRRGMDIEPVTLEVGDYILTPDVCVERKSVSDLIGSLNNGRLYNQCVSMCRYYKRPILLIEFDPNKSFSLQGKYQMSNDVSVQETTTRLTLLTLHFPKLRVLWCQSPYATAELFEEIKMGREQPDANEAMTVSSVEDIEWSDKYSHQPQDMLLRMPGVNSKNYRQIMNKVQDLAELSTMSEVELTSIMGHSQNAKQLWNFLHKEHNPSDNATSTKTAKSEAGKRWNKRKR
ncbi:DNA repair endonuclease XPF-like isoform X1 [Mercenaria mercenaria]|uniref:DNA repair endonuclease XPF-like isoform X1 n=1 Tax=Mercenaria mercenaria TaxID=6596 RepID=UPI00234EBB2A|nr:DNA repair endonuclease XPF-like isoform X1 [Mercenaria mercenaria]XP_045159648.2 DNA repair endonuclease XPF-like isoform X1 [Mercenaria mercenaria]